MNDYNKYIKHLDNNLLLQGTRLFGPFRAGVSQHGYEMKPLNRIVLRKSMSYNVRGYIDAYQLKKFLSDLFGEGSYIDIFIINGAHVSIESTVLDLNPDFASASALLLFIVVSQVLINESKGCRFHPWRLCFWV